MSDTVDNEGQKEIPLQDITQQENAQDENYLLKALHAGDKNRQQKYKSLETGMHTKI